MELWGDRGGLPSNQRAQTGVDWQARWYCCAGLVAVLVPCLVIRRRDGSEGGKSIHELHFEGTDIVGDGHLVRMLDNEVCI